MLSLMLILACFTITAKANETIASASIQPDGFMSWALYTDAEAYCVSLNGVSYYTSVTNMNLAEKASSQSLSCGSYQVILTATNGDFQDISEPFYLTYNYHKFDGGEEITEATCTKEGVIRYTCTVCSFELDYKTGYGEHQFTDIIKKATLSKDGKVTTKCRICGEEESTYKISRPAKFSVSNCVYNGKAQKPAVKIKNADGETIDSGYKVKYSENTKIGTAKAKITFKSNYYEGTKTVTFKINPKGTKLTKLSGCRKAFTAFWKKSAQVTGYQLQYSANSNFKNAKTVTLKSTKKTVTKLSAKKKYYVRIRTYKTVGKTKYYSKWSKAETVKTK